MEAQLTSGSRLGPYEILNELGAGGMGAVYKARDTRLGRTVAIKISSAEWSRRSETEARASATLNHPHICGLYDIGEQDGIGYLVMEYIEGQTLSARLKQSPLKINDAVRFGAQIADALAAAHAHGIIHRDLKPGNIMLTKGAGGETSVKVLDFGLAKFEMARQGQESLTATNAVLGTLEYMSPEQLEGTACDSRSDIYSLGLVLYEMATGKRAFAEILRGGAAPLTGVPALLARVLRRCLERDSSRRWQSALDLKLELEAIAVTGEQSGWKIEPDPRPKTAIRRTAFAGLWALAGVLACWLGVLALDPGAAREDRLQWDLTPFATGLPSQADPVWSPDGKQIAFRDAGDDYQGNLYVQTIGASVPTRVTHPPFAVYGWFRPFWSADSRSIYVQVGYSPSGDPDGLWRVSTAGGDPVLVQEDAASGALSPDGRTLAMFAPVGQTGDSIWVASPPESKRREYGPRPFLNEGGMTHRYLAFSPDGKKLLACFRSGGAAQWWLMPWPPGASQRVLPDISTVLPFTWFRDSRHVAIGAGKRLVIADVQTGAMSSPLLLDHQIASVSAAPDGARIAIQSSLSRTAVVSAPLNGGLIATVLPHALAAVCSPNARQVVYQNSGATEIWAKNLDDSSSKPILTAADHPAPKGGQYLMPNLSPDGQRIAFTSPMANREAKVFVSFVSNPSPVRLTAEDSHVIDPGEGWPTWSPDGNWIAFGYENLYKARVGTQQQPVILHEHGQRKKEGPFVLGPRWSPTGEWIVYLWGQTLLVSPDGKQKRELSKESWPSAWSRDGKTLYQVRSEARDFGVATETASLFAIEVATGAERVVRQLGDFVPYPNNYVILSLTPDGKDIVYSINRPREEIWLLKGFRLPASGWRKLLLW